MASKKAASKKKASPSAKKSGKPGKAPVQLPDISVEHLKCNPPNICKFLEQLSDWLRYRFLPDYTALRIAVCNVEKQAFAGAGINTRPPKFCTGAAVNEPAPPPPPPVW